MNIFDIFKTNKQLRAENRELKATIERYSAALLPRPTCAKEELRVEKLTATVTDSRMSIEMIKGLVRHKLAKQIEPFIESEYTMNKYTGEVSARGSIMIAIKE